MNSTNASPAAAIRTASMVRLAAVAGGGWFMAGRLRASAYPPQSLVETAELMLWGGALVGLAAVAAMELFDLVGGRLPRTPLHPPAGPGWSPGRQRRFVLSWVVVLAITAAAFFTAVVGGAVYLLAPSLEGGRALLSGVDPATKLRLVVGAGATLGAGFFVVGLPRAGHQSR